MIKIFPLLGFTIVNCLLLSSFSEAQSQPLANESQEVVNLANTTESKSILVKKCFDFDLTGKETIPNG